jgi:hypothetical protein
MGVSAVEVRVSGRFQTQHCLMRLRMLPGNMAVRSFRSEPSSLLTRPTQTGGMVVPRPKNREEVGLPNIVAFGETA